MPNSDQNPGRKMHSGNSRIALKFASSQRSSLA